MVADFPTPPAKVSFAISNEYLGVAAGRSKGGEWGWGGGRRWAGPGRGGRRGKGCGGGGRVGGEGGNIGPALDGIAARKGEDYLRKSLVEPNADIAENYPAPVSPMPPMNLLLGEQEIEDVLAYIATLK
mgnify:CR=1 FL=1